MRMDAHQHYWKMSRNDYGWITPDMDVLYRDYMPGDLAAHLHEHEITKTIVVQAAPTIEETEFLLSVSEEEESIAGVVGWLDLTDPAHRIHFERLSRHQKFVGFRVMIQDMEEPTRILEPAVIDAFRGYAERGTPIDLLVKASQLPVVLELLSAVPTLRGVIDHIAKPDIAHAIYEPWKSQMASIAEFPSTYCKVSGMVTEADHQHWKASDFVPYVHHVLDVFGANRVMYGSDWPVCLLAASYDQVWQVAQSSLPETFTEAERLAIFGSNAATFYKL